MPESYALNNFNKAVRIFAKAGIGKREWLCSKYVEHLCQLELSDIPDPLRHQFIQFKRDMKVIQAECKAGTIKTTVNTMDDAHVGEMIARILAMHRCLLQLTLPEQEPAREKYARKGGK